MDDVGDLRDLIAQCASALSQGNAPSAQEALTSLLEKLQPRVRKGTVAQLSHVVRSDLIASSFEEWLSRLLLRGPPELADVVAEILDTLNAQPNADESGDDNEALPITLGSEKFLLAPSSAIDPDWTMADGTMVWAGARVAARMILSAELEVKDKRVLELGCGLGLPGIVCLRAGSCEVVFTDYDKGCLRAVEKTAELNGYGTTSRVVSLDWFNLPPDANEFAELVGCSEHPFDLVLGADVMGEDVHAEALQGVIHRFLQEGHAKEVVLITGMPDKRSGVGIFAELIGLDENAFALSGCEAGSCNDSQVAWSVRKVPGIKAGQSYRVHRFNAS